MVKLFDRNSVIGLVLSATRCRFQYIIFIYFTIITQVLTIAFRVVFELYIGIHDHPVFNLMAH